MKRLVQITGTDRFGTPRKQTHMIAAAATLSTTVKRCKSNGWQSMRATTPDGKLLASIVTGRNADDEIERIVWVDFETDYFNPPATGPTSVDEALTLAERRLEDALARCRSLESEIRQALNAVRVAIATKGASS